MKVFHPHSVQQQSLVAHSIFTYSAVKRVFRSVVTS